MFINFYKKFFACKNRKSTIYDSDLEILTQMHSYFFSVSAYTLVTCTFYYIYAFHNNCIFLLKSYIRHKYTLRVLWNYVYSLRPKFVNYPKFAGSLWRNYGDYWFVELESKSIHYFVERSWGGKCTVEATHRIMNIDDFIVSLNILLDF